jgi:hypothetical protein
MSNKYEKHCGCSAPHAVTKVQRQYARRALSVAQSMRDRTAIAKIRDALAPCPRALGAKEQELASQYLASVLRAASEVDS